MNFPASIKDVRRFEANNEIAINVFSLDKEDDNYEIYPHSISKEDFGGKAIDLLLYQKHFILIVCIDRCINSGNGHNCNRCLHGFKSKENRDSHMQCCGLFKPCKTNMLLKDDTKIKFSDTKCLTILAAILRTGDYERPNTRWYQPNFTLNVIRANV